ncbi:UNKNOWN [Stylonychia lemnae]|uniref:Uncharacterized protein n=1 Tax=Stylonychia lemnae TaxID=5949 RepID=A0A078AK73_STYLE|nr:UNKNOWN [Stylonychia lemnae]|eukprot:CDW82584.1 UNKNOWN [Stylonychia lemnae]
MEDDIITHQARLKEALLRKPNKRVASELSESQQFNASSHQHEFLSANGGGMSLGHSVKDDGSNYYSSTSLYNSKATSKSQSRPILTGKILIPIQLTITNANKLRCSQTHRSMKNPQNRSEGQSDWSSEDRDKDNEDEEVDRHSNHSLTKQHKDSIYISKNNLKLNMFLNVSLLLEQNQNRESSRSIPNAVCFRFMSTTDPIEGLITISNYVKNGCVTLYSNVEDREKVLLNIHSIFSVLTLIYDKNCQYIQTPGSNVNHNNIQNYNTFEYQPIKQNDNEKTHGNEITENPKSNYHTPNGDSLVIIDMKYSVNNLRSRFEKYMTTSVFNQYKSALIWIYSTASVYSSSEYIYFNGKTDSKLPNI